MATLSSLRARRAASRRAEATEQLIAFRLRQEWFALPITSVQRVVTLGKVFGDPNATGISFTLYQNQEILVIDVGHRIFTEAKPSTQEAALDSQVDHQHSPPDRVQHRCLIILQNPEGDLLGLPIDSQPEIRKIPKSGFLPLPPAYKTRGNIRCVSSMMIQADDQPPLFLLDPKQLSSV